jgi:tetratricopeptide (TPR) repeat protein
MERKVIARVLVIAAAAVVSVWALRAWVYAPVHCNAEVTALELQTDLAGNTTDSYERTVRARRNLERLAELRAMCPAEVRVPVIIATNEELVGRLEDAAAHYAEALRIEERPEIHAELGRVQVELGRVDQAVESYATAGRFHPLMLSSIGSEELLQRVQRRLGTRP